jgi:endonuclease/exonuclease/phosphatase family metal-dependent hydrolase
VPDVCVASFNVHCGVDGWGRPFDVVDACRRLDADVLVLQETWTPSEGAEGGDGPEGPEGTAEEVAAALGYTLTSVPTAPARRYPVPARPGGGWGPGRGRRHGVGVRVEAENRPPGRARGRRGVIGLGLLSRLPSVTDVFDLGRRRGDGVRRVAVRATVADPEVVVVATHLPHIRHGSPLDVRRLQRLLRSGDADAAAVVTGDMNMWGPPLTVLLPGFSRAVRGRSWPAWRPLFQIDHVLVRSPVRVVEGSVVHVGGSDHLPVRAVLSVP